MAAKIKKERKKVPGEKTSEPVKGLFNPEVEAQLSKADYCSAVLDQWKTANELTGNISSQRNNINNFYISLLSLLIGGVLLSDGLMREERTAKTAILLMIMALGIFCCRSWVCQVKKCKEINRKKFAIIAELEKKLPAKVLSWEDKVPAPVEEKQKGRSRNLSDYERLLAWVFGAAIVIIVVIMILEVWWEPIWMLVENL